MLSDSLRAASLRRKTEYVSDSAFWIDGQQLWTGEEPLRAPLALIDLSRADNDPPAIALPPCPVIGFGAEDHPMAAQLDVVVQTGAQLAAIKRQVIACPNAAMVVTQLLRLLPALSLPGGLVAESLAYGLLQGGVEHRGWLARQPEIAPFSGDDVVDVVRQDDVLTITLNRPQAGNAISCTMRDALRAGFDLAALDPTIRRVRLRGAGRTFSLGADLGEFGTSRDPATAHHIRSLTLPAHAIARCGDRLDVHVQGGCVGAGLEMAAFAQRITATADSWFHLPELAMGIMPGAGGCVALTRRIGRRRTTQMILSGKRISAQQALGWGLIDAITSDESGANVIS